MKKLFISALIIGCTFTLAGCDNNTTSANANTPTQSEQSTTNQDKTNTTDTDNTSSIDTTQKDEHNKKDDISKDEEKKTETNSNEEKENAKVDKNDSTDNSKDKNNTSSSKDESKQDTTSKSSTDISNYYGTWHISEVIGHTGINTGNKGPLNKTITISKDSYVNNSVGIKIKKPVYLNADLSDSAFCRAYNISNLNDTGFTGKTIHAIDISSPNPQGDSDEIFLQDGYVIYIEGGIVFKCVK